jgi:hypothetical protein
MATKKLKLILEVAEYNVYIANDSPLKDVEITVRDYDAAEDRDEEEMKEIEELKLDEEGTLYWEYEV